MITKRRKGGAKLKLMTEAERLMLLRHFLQHASMERAVDEIFPHLDKDAKKRFRNSALSFIKNHDLESYKKLSLYIQSQNC